MLTTPLTALHFAPTAAAADNLRARAHRRAADHRHRQHGHRRALHGTRAPAPAGRRQHLAARLRERVGPDYGTRPFVLITGHRRENFAPASSRFATPSPRSPSVPRSPVYLPGPPQPEREDRRHYERLGNTENIRLIDPQPYSEFVALMAACGLAQPTPAASRKKPPASANPSSSCATHNAPKASPPAPPSWSAQRHDHHHRSLPASYRQGAYRQCPKPPTPTATARPLSGLRLRWNNTCQYDPGLQYVGHCRPQAKHAEHTASEH